MEGPKIGALKQDLKGTLSRAVAMDAQLLLPLRHKRVAKGIDMAEQFE